MTTFKRPMLAAALLSPSDPHTDESIYAAMQKLKYPVLVSTKKDGIRALRLKHNGVDSLLSRTLKPIPNHSIRERSLVMPSGFDMELWNPSLSYDEVQSIVMSAEHPDSDLIEFHVLDWILDVGYYDRQTLLDDWFVDYGDEMTDVLMKPAILALNADNLFTYFTQSENEGQEGICFRTPDSPYKQGRSTLKEQYLIKLCRNLRSEVTIVGFMEQMENGNAEDRNTVGMMDRSSHQVNMFPKDTLGAFVVVDNKNRHFNVGTGVGLTDKLRKHIWMNAKQFLGKQITIKYKPHGEKDLPRSPIFVGFREDGQ